MGFNLGTALVVFLTASTPTSGDGSQPVQSVRETVPLITPADLKRELASGKPVLVDVREPDEFAAGHIEGAKLIPLGTLEAAYSTLPKDGKLVVYCRSGKRSAKAVSVLAAHGYSNAVSLDGGYLAWTKPSN